MESNISNFILAFDKDVKIKRKLMKDIEFMVLEKFKNNEKSHDHYIFLIKLLRKNVGTFRVGSIGSGYKRITRPFLLTELEKNKCLNVGFNNIKLEENFLSKIEKIMDIITEKSEDEFMNEMNKYFVLPIIETNRDYLCWNFLD